MICCFFNFHDWNIKISELQILNSNFIRFETSEIRAFIKGKNPCMRGLFICLELGGNNHSLSNTS